MRQIEIEVSSKNLQDLIARAAEGEDIIICVKSKPLVRLTPIEKAEQQILNEAEEIDNTLLEEMLSAFQDTQIENS